MNSVRFIPRLDIKGSNLIKGVHLEGLRVVGDPQSAAKRYYEQGADELLYVDVVASLYGRNSLHDFIRRTTAFTFVPLTVTGGIRSTHDVQTVLRCGADKVGINTAAIGRPELIREVAEQFGSQCMVLSVEAKRVGPGRWEAYTDNGRERTGKDVVDWIRQGCELGAGEILLTSVDQEGTRSGFDIELLAAATRVANVPIIASGGMGSIDHMLKALEAGVDAVAIADALHYDRLALGDIRAAALEQGYDVRRDAGIPA